LCIEQLDDFKHDLISALFACSPHLLQAQSPEPPDHVNALCNKQSLTDRFSLASSHGHHGRAIHLAKLTCIWKAQHLTGCMNVRVLI